MSTVLPPVVGPSGPSPTPPTTLQQALINSVAQQVPDYTANLPGSLIEDISSTDVGALVMMDQARVDAINSVSPYGSNAAVLLQQGQMFGIALGLPANGSVLVQFTGTAGYAIPQGFVVSDGTNQYVLTSGGVVSASGTSPLLTAVATTSDVFNIPAGSVTTVVSAVPSGYTLTVTNPQAGTPAQSAESVESYRSRVMASFAATVGGTPAYLKSLLYGINGVTTQAVAVNQTANGWQVVCGGGDSYEIANAILSAVPDISALQGSQLKITGMSAASPVVVTTNLDSNLAAGATFTVAGATPTAYNITYTVASVSGTSITTTTDGSAFGTYTGGATFSPNPRNVVVSIYQNPDTYTVLYVDPPQQLVTVAVTWNTQLQSFASAAAVASAGAQAVRSYINGISVGQPINLLELQQAFTASVESIIDTSNVTTFQTVITIDGVTATPAAGTNVIASDPEGYFYCGSGDVTVTQG